MNDDATYASVLQWGIAKNQSNSHSWVKGYLLLTCLAQFSFVVRMTLTALRFAASLTRNIRTSALRWFYQNILHTDVPSCCFSSVFRIGIQWGFFF